MLRKVFKAIKPVHVMIAISAVSTAVSTWTCYRLSEPKTHVTISYPKGFLDKMDDINTGLKVLCSINGSIYSSYSIDLNNDYEYNTINLCDSLFKKIKTSKN